MIEKVKQSFLTFIILFIILGLLPIYILFTSKMFIYKDNNPKVDF